MNDFGLIVKADKEKLDSILFKDAASDTYLTKSALSNYVAEILPTNTGFIAYNGRGEIVCNAVLRRGKSKPELSINKNSIDIPDTITASWNGGGALSVSLQNDIANYAVSGSKIIFSQKPNHANGIYSTNGLISVGENENYDSDSATFSATAYYLPSPDLRLSAYHATFGGLMAGSTNVAARWKGNGILSIVAEASDYYTYEIQNAAYDSTTDISTANIIFTKNLTPSNNYFAAPVIHVSNSNSFAPQNFNFTVACANTVETLRTATLSANTELSEEFIYVLDNSNINDRIFNYARCNYLYFKTGDDYLYSESDFCTLRGGEGNNTIYSDGKCCYVNNYISKTTTNDSIKSYGDYCTIYTGAGNHTIYSEGKNCSINAYKSGDHKIESYGDFCTVISYSGSDTVVIEGNECYCSLRGTQNKITIDGANSTLNCYGAAELKSYGSYCNLYCSMYGAEHGSNIYSEGSYCTIQGGSNYDTIYNDGFCASINAGSSSQNSVRCMGAKSTISIRGGILDCWADENYIEPGSYDVQINNLGNKCTISPSGGRSTIINDLRWANNLTLDISSRCSIEVYNLPSQINIFVGGGTESLSTSGDDLIIRNSNANSYVTLYGGNPDKANYNITYTRSA